MRYRHSHITHFMPLRYWGVAVCLGVIGLLGCEEDVNAVLGAEQPYTLYGLLTPAADTQWVRVYEVANQLTPIAPVPLSAHFTSVDLNTGEERVWQDSLLQEQNGSYAHVFWSPFRAAYGHRYRLSVTDAKGAASVSEVDVPPFTRIEIDDSRQFPPVVLNLNIVGGAPRLYKVEVRYGIDYRSNGGPKLDAVTFSHGNRLRQDGDTWILPLNMSNDVSAIRTELRNLGGFDLNVGILLTGVTVRYLVASEDWDPPNGTFDPEVLVEPGTLSNVENGFGFVAAGYRDHCTWLPPEDVRRAAGFRVIVGATPTNPPPSTCP